MAETLLPVLIPQLGALRVRLFGRFMARRKTKTTSVSEPPPAEKPAVVPAQITQEEASEWSQAQAQQQQDIEQSHLTTPQHVGTHTNWQGDTAEVWYYPDSKLYGVVVPGNQALNTGPKYAQLEDAVAYARGALGMK